MFLHRVINIENDIKKISIWHEGNLSYTSMILYMKIVTLKNYASGKITNFQSDLFLKATWRLLFKEHSSR